MADDLRIVIKGTIDPNATQQEIQSQLDKISKDLNIQLGINSKEISEYTKQINQLQSQVEKLKSQINQPSNNGALFNTTDTVNGFKLANIEVSKLFTGVDEAVKEFSKLGQVKVSANLDPVTDELKNFTLQVRNAKEGLTENFSFGLSNDKNLDVDGNDLRLWELTSRNVVDNSQKVTQEIREQNKNLEHQVDLFKRQMQVNVQNLQRTHGGFVDNTGIQNLLTSVNGLSVATPNARKEMDKLSMQFREISVDAKSVAGATQQAGMGFGEMLSTAMTKFPIWMIASTAFYGTINALTQISHILVEIDTQMVELQKVMDEGTNFDDMLASSIELAERFSVSIQDINNAMVGFARAGFSEQEVLDLAGVSAALQQISDLSADEAMDTLVASMVQFNVASEDAMMIADRLNEIDNNYSVTVRQLSESLSRAGDSSVTFGISLENLLGMTTSIATTTRESGSVIGNSLKSIFSRITTLDESVETLRQLGIEVENANGTYRRVEDILTDLASIWDNLTNAQQQQTAVTLAG